MSPVPGFAFPDRYRWSTRCVPALGIAKSTLTQRTGTLCAMSVPSSATINMTALSLLAELLSWFMEQGRVAMPTRLLPSCSAFIPSRVAPLSRACAELGRLRSKSLFIQDLFQVIWNLFLGPAPGRFPFCSVLQTRRTHWKAHRLSCLNNYLQT